MKVHIHLSSEHISEEDNIRYEDNPIETYWNLPVLPNKGDNIGLESIVGYQNVPESIDNRNLSWTVERIFYFRDYDSYKIIPTIYLEGRKR